MARTWGATRAKFWDVAGAWPSTSPLTVNGATYLETVVDGSVTWTRLISQVGQGSASFYATADWDEWLIPGRVCVVEKVTNHTVGAARLLACFIIEDIEPKVANGVNVVDVRGPGIEGLLTKQLLWSPIGSATITNTTITVKADAPSVRSIAQGSPPGNDSLILNTTNSDDIGQEIRITLDGAAGVHVTYITERFLYEGATWYIKIADRLPAAASTGNHVEIWTRRIRVGNPAPFLADVYVSVTMNGGAIHETFATGELDTTDRVTLRDGLPTAANVGNAVMVSNPFAPTTADVSQILSQAPGWTAVFQTGTGTALGSAHRPQGESAFDLLSTLSQRTGEFFRQRVLTNPNAPHKSIDWRRTADSSGVTLVMYDSDEQARQATDEMSTTKGAVISLSRKRSLPLITAVFPSAGDQLINLTNCSTDAINYANSKGCSIVPGYGLYEPSYVKHNAGYATYGMHEVRQTYGDISLSDAKNTTALIAACDQLLLSAVQTLVTAQAREYYTVDCYCPVPLLPGQTVKIENATRTTPSVATSGDWTILEVTERLVQGRPRTTLSVSNMSGLRWTPAAQFARTIRELVQGQRRVAGAAGGGTTIVTAGGGTGGATDHGDLTGLADDDHPQYLLASGGRALAGNLTVAAGATIDGVDISAHVANPSAHHPPVTVQDASLAINGQSLRVSDAFAGPGLALAGGIASVNTAAGLGTTVTSDTVGVFADVNGGVMVGTSGVKVRLPGNSGLTVDAAGLAVGTPGTLTATSANTVSGSQHTHGVTATENAKTTPATLLKGSSGGDLTLRTGIADRLTTPIVDTASGGLRLDPANGVTTNDGNLTFIGARAITTDTGSLTLSPAQTLVLGPADSLAQLAPTTTLKTAHWASGFLGTGWGVTYDGAADFRSIYADELHVAAFIADTARVAVGAEYITPSMAVLARAFTVPAVGATQTLWVENAPTLGALPVFADNDWVLLRIFDRSGGGLLVANAWGQVRGYQAQSGDRQTWTFTTQATTAAGQSSPAGAIALDFGKSGDGWWWVTTLDPAGSPYAGITTWQGANPYDEGNRTHRLRMGQLRGVSGVYEWGLQAGAPSSSFVRFSDLRNEIHGTRLSLYAGDGGKLQVAAVDVLLYRSGTQSSTLKPDSDGAAVNVESTAGNYWSAIDEGAAAPGYSDYIANSANMPGAVFLGLSNPTSFTSIFRVDIKAALKSIGLSNDTIALYGQIFRSDDVTPLTGEVLLATRTTNTTATVTVTAPHEGYGAGGALTSDWNGARLRLRWEYQINANEEAIRLDPSIPSLAVGNPLPTGLTTGGSGIWMGLAGGNYLFRVGDAAGTRLVWTGTNLQFVNSDNATVISLDNAGNSTFTGVMTIGASGGIWQGTGTFASPTSGLKLYNSGGVGRLSTYNAGLEQITINTAGQLVAGGGKIILDRAGLRMLSTLGDASWLDYAVRWNRAANGVNLGTIVAREVGTNIANLEIGAHYDVYSSGLAVDNGIQIMSNLSSPGSSEINIDTTGHAYIGGGSDLQMRAGSNGNNPILIDGTPVTMTHTAIIGGGLALGSTSLTPPAAGRILMAQSSGATMPPAGTALIYLENQANNKQALWVRFDDGTFVKLGESAS